MSGTPSLFAGIGAQLLDNVGNPLSGGKIFSYYANTTTPIATYTTETANVAHPNPIILDSAGRVPSGGEIWLKEGDTTYYKFVIQTSAGVDLATYDFVPGTYSSADLAGPNGASLVGFTGFKDQVGTVADLADDDGSDWIGFEGLGDSIPISAQDKLRQIVNVMDYGAVGDGVAEDSDAFIKANAALTDGGIIHVPSGEFKISLTVELGEGVIVQGIGKNTVILSNASSSNGDEVNGLFCAKNKEFVGLSNLSIKVFPGVGEIRSKFILCDFVFLQNVFIDGDLDSGDISSQAIWIAGCNATSIMSSVFLNCRDSIYICKSDFNLGTTSGTVSVSDCYFENINFGTSHSYITGVYVYYGEHTRVTNCMFKNIVPSTNTPGHAGYAFYEGDGEATTVLISDCTVLRTSSFPTDSQVNGFLAVTAKSFQVNNCTFRGLSNAKITRGVDYGGLNSVITSNTFEECGLPIGLGESAGSTGYCNYVISGNSLFKTAEYGIRLGAASRVADVVTITGNTINRCGKSGILFNALNSPFVICSDNTIIDANTLDSNIEPEFSGIAFYGDIGKAVVSGNLIYNNPGIGFARYAVSKGTGEPVVITADNIFANMITASVLRPFTSFPTRGLWDRGDRIPYWNVSSSGTEGTVCVFALRTTLSATAANGATSITVSSGTDTANGDIIGVMQDDGTIHWTTIASGGGTTSITLTSATTDDALNGNEVWIYRWKNYGVIA